MWSTCVRRGSVCGHHRTFYLIFFSLPRRRLYDSDAQTVALFNTGETRVTRYIFFDAEIWVCVTHLLLWLHPVLPQQHKCVFKFKNPEQ